MIEETNLYRVQCSIDMAAADSAVSVAICGRGLCLTDDVYCRRQETNLKQSSMDTTAADSAVPARARRAEPRARAAAHRARPCRGQRSAHSPLHHVYDFTQHLQLSSVYLSLGQRQVSRPYHFNTDTEHVYSSPSSDHKHQSFLFCVSSFHVFRTMSFRITRSIDQNTCTGNRLRYFNTFWVSQLSFTIFPTNLTRFELRKLCSYISTS